MDNFINIDSTCSSKSTGCPNATREVGREIEQFLYREASLLDDFRYTEWLELFTDDLRYWMPVMERRYRTDSKGVQVLATEQYKEREFSSETEVGLLDETKDSLARRIERFETGMAWAEDPPSRTCYVISNVIVSDGARETEKNVRSNFILYRTRGDMEQDFYVGCRHDVLRLVNGDWKISYRKIILPQNVLASKNISNFF